MKAKEKIPKEMKNIQEAEKDTMHKRYLLTLNNPFDFGYSPEYINKTLQDNFKSLLYYCFRRRKRKNTSYPFIYSIQDTCSFLPN